MIETAQDFVEGAAGVDEDGRPIRGPEPTAEEIHEGDPPEEGEPTSNGQHRDEEKAEASTRDRVFQLPDPISWEELERPVDYSDTLLGDRFLERGCGFILFGPAGVGKSVAGFQAIAEWAAGLDGLHIKPAHPLKIVLLQTEDSANDYRETWAGIRASSLISAPDKLALLKQNLIILPPIPGGNALHLAAVLNAAAEKYHPDLVYVNPLLAFCPTDPARDLGGLLYQTVDPIIKRHRIGFMAVHHTPKTNNRDTSGYKVHDFQYLAAGDARVANWPRGMIQIEPVANGVYLFRATKRARRTGWTWDREPTDERYFRHSKTEIRWLDASPDDVSEAKAVEDYQRILEVLPAAGEAGASRDRVRDEAKKKLRIGKDKADAWLRLAIEDGTVEQVKTRTSNNRESTLFRCSAKAAE